jgi:acyl-CoA thioester hydrolase
MNAIFVHRLEVRFRDCDPLGHVNNAVYLTYLEQARFAHWRAVWGFNFEGLPEGDARRHPRAG